MKNKHISFDERIEIEKGLTHQKSFKEIGRTINKDCTTVAKEVKAHLQFKQVGAVGRPFCDCVYRKKCEFREKGTKCNPTFCGHYKKEECPKLKKAPYVCNGCPNKASCTLGKQIYDAIYALKEYQDTLVGARQGITYNELEIKRLNEILKPLIKEKGQSIHHAYINNKNSIMCSEKEIYHLIELGVLEVRNIDLPRKVRFRTRSKKHTAHKIDPTYLEGRSYSDYLSFIKENPDTNIIEMDSVEGVKGGKVLLTIHFVNCSFMLAFLRKHNDAQSVIDIFNHLESILGLNIFKKLFVVTLTDNGSEFSNPKEIETSILTKEARTKVFYCEPAHPEQKGSCEVNHELIRRILPKGTSFDNLTQEDIVKMMSHINSYKRKKLNDCSPLQLFSLIYGKDIANKLGMIEIQPNEINLSPHLIKKR